jgi:uncharacterized protein
LCNYTWIVERLRFEWDEAKNLANRRKHGVAFEDAADVFFDPLCVSVLDRIEDGEERWLTIGAVENLVLLAVAHTLREERGNGAPLEVIRIISARAATRKEKRRYEDENG